MYSVSQGGGMTVVKRDGEVLVTIPLEAGGYDAAHAIVDAVNAAEPVPVVAKPEVVPITDRAPAEPKPEPVVTARRGAR